MRGNEGYQAARLNQQSSVLVDSFSDTGGDEEAFSSFSEAVLLELVVELLNSLVAHASLAGSNLLLLEIEEFLGVGQSLVLELLDQVLLGPAALGSEITELAELTVRLQSKALEGLWHNDSLLVVIWEGASLEDLEAGKSSGTLSLLVREHGAESLPENTGWGLVVHEVLLGVGVTSLVNDFTSLEPVSEKGARNVNRLATDHNDTLSVNELLGNNRGKATEHMTAAIDDNFLFEHA